VIGTERRGQPAPTRDPRPPAGVAEGARTHQSAWSRRSAQGPETAVVAARPGRWTTWWLPRRFCLTGQPAGKARSVSPGSPEDPGRSAPLLPTPTVPSLPGPSSAPLSCWRCPRTQHGGTTGPTAARGGRAALRFNNSEPRSPGPKRVPNPVPHLHLGVWLSPFKVTLLLQRVTRAPRRLRDARPGCWLRLLVRPVLHAELHSGGGWLPSWTFGRLKKARNSSGRQQHLSLSKTAGTRGEDVAEGSGVCGAHKQSLRSQSAQTQMAHGPLAMQHRPRWGCQHKTRPAAQSALSQHKNRTSRSESDQDGRGCVHNRVPAPRQQEPQPGREGTDLGRSRGSTANCCCGLETYELLLVIYGVRVLPRCSTPRSWGPGRRPKAPS
jgi:hypothetical protein